MECGGERRAGRPQYVRRPHVARRQGTLGAALPTASAKVPLRRVQACLRRYAQAGLAQSRHAHAGVAKSLQGRDHTRRDARRRAGGGDANRAELWDARRRAWRSVSAKIAAQRSMRMRRRPATAQDCRPPCCGAELSHLV